MVKINMSVQLHICGIIFCFIFTAFCAGLEIGVLSVNRVRLLHYVRDGLKAAELLEHYLENAQSFLGSILVGTNLSNVILSTLSASLAQQLFAEHAYFQSIWAFFMASMVVVFCEYLPKLLFESRPLRRTLPLVSVFSIVEKVLRPITKMVLFITQWVIPGNGRDSTDKLVVTREYLQDVVSDKKRGARITAIERMMIKRVLDLQNHSAADIMTPLAKITKVSENTPLQECYKLVRKCGHVRLPVFSTSGKKCAGILHVLDVLSFAPDPALTCAGSYVQPPFFVSNDLRADDLLPLMRRNRQPMAFVRNKEAEVIGIVTEANILGLLTVNLANS